MSTGTIVRVEQAFCKGCGHTIGSHGNGECFGVIKTEDDTIPCGCVEPDAVVVDLTYAEVLKDGRVRV
jgi:hypothetical protein